MPSPKTSAIWRCDLWCRSRVIPGGCGGGECPHGDGDGVQEVAVWALEGRATVEGVT
jgi:hypothetical protein